MTEGPAFIRTGSDRGADWPAAALARRSRRAVSRVRRSTGPRVDRFVFVCTGNICRSPYAERRGGCGGISAISIALRGETGRPPTPSPARRRCGPAPTLAITAPPAADAAELRPGDLLVAMEPWQARMLAARFPGHQITLLGLWTTPRRPHLHDPYTLSPAYFRTCFRLIDTGVAALLARTGR
jgi:protein-tyrosine phosphatase